MKSTLRNLDRVLGVCSPTVKIRKPRAPSRRAPEKRVPDTVIADFVEKVNGRCAVSGLYIGKAMFEFTGQDLFHQLVDDPVQAAALVGADFAVFTALTAVTYKKINYDNLFEFGEILMYRYSMAMWVWIILQYIF